VASEILLICSIDPSHHRLRDVNGIYQGIPLLDWWDSVEQICTVCRSRLLSPSLAGWPTPQTTLKELKRMLLLEMVDGVHCYLCGAYTHSLSRPLNSGMARALIVIYRAFGTAYGDLPALVQAHRIRNPKEHPLGGEEPKLRYWGLLEEHPTQKACYRVTPEGEQWVLGNIYVRKCAVVVHTRCVAQEGPPWTIRDALGTKFDLDTLLRVPPLHIPPGALP
jgi:hypothetical protein